MEAVKTQPGDFAQVFDKLAAQRNGGEPEWMKRRRQEALERFLEHGLPTTRQEAWRYTDIGLLAKTDFSVAPEATASSSMGPFSALSPVRLVFANGRLVSSDLGEQPGGIRIQSLSEALSEDDSTARKHLGRYASRPEHVLADLNLALAEDGAVIHVAAGGVIETPIHLVFWSSRSDTPWVANPRVLIVAEESSRVSVIETYLAEKSETRYFNNAVTEIVAGDNALVRHYKLQLEGQQGFHMGTVEIEQGRAANVGNSTLTLGGGIVRNETGSRLNGEGGWCEMDGLFLISGDGHVDNFTRLEHAKAHCDSREFYKGILDDRGKGVFRGRIIVAEGAQKTDSKQTNSNLLLSDSAKINTKPQLEIYADDVKCTHGATIGQLEDEAIFYLRSRGIDLPAARSLLIYAFANEIAERISVESLRREMAEYLFAWLPQGEVVRGAV